MKLSIIIPVYNEAKTIEEIVSRVLGTKISGISERELIICDDASLDGTGDIIKNLAQKYSGIKVIAKPVNEGKGSAIRAMIGLVTGEVTIIQDADLEYDPDDYTSILEPILCGEADVVYGSRFLIPRKRRVSYFRHYIGNRALTLASNLFTNLNLTDMETCYKAFNSEILKTIPIRSNRFNIEPELTAKIAKRKLRLYEVPISYNGRPYEDGKKIGWKDAVHALWTIVKFWAIDDSKLEGC